jgi:hypothetical protein
MSIVIYDTELKYDVDFIAYDGDYIEHETDWLQVDPTSATWTDTES